MSTVRDRHPGALCAALAIVAACAGAPPEPAPSTPSSRSTSSTASTPSTARPAPRPPTNGDSVARLAADYGLTIATRKSKLGVGARTQGPKLGGNYDWDFLTKAEDPVLDQHLASLVGYWRRFPPSFVKAVGLQGILFVKNLRWNGIQVYGFEVTDRVVFVNLTLGGRLYFPGDDEFRYGLTHEFFHLIQNVLARDARFVDYDEWDALNPKGFAYHPDGTMGMLKEAQGRKDLWAWLHDEHPEPGFVSRYAMSDHYHDTTETFCSLFVTARYRKLVQWTRKDAALRKKVDYLKAALRRIEPTLTDAYYEEIHR